MKDPHEPCSCELWVRWKEDILNNMSGKPGVKVQGSEFKVHPYVSVTEEDRARVAGEAQANAQWIIRNTKPCPNCQ